MKHPSAVAAILSAGMFMALAGSAAAQQAYPNKLIRLIVPYAPGGGTSIVARHLSQKLSESLGQQVIVDNRPGGGTIIGSEALLRSPPDGYTIMLIGGSYVINPSLISRLPYDTIKDFAPVATATSSELALVLHPSVPANTLQEFIALAKSKPGQLSYAAADTGGPGHLAGELFKIMTGVRMQFIPYKGSGPALTDLLGGHVQLAFMNPLNVVSHIRTGQLKPIAISGETRLWALPRVPTFTEAGLPGFEARNWFGICAPAGTPKEIINKLSTEIARILVMPEIKEKLASQGLEPFISTPEQFAALIKADIARYAGIIKTAKIELEK